MCGIFRYAKKGFRVFGRTDLFLIGKAAGSIRAFRDIFTTWVRESNEKFASCIEEVVIVHCCSGAGAFARAGRFRARAGEGPDGSGPDADVQFLRRSELETDAGRQGRG